MSNTWLLENRYDWNGVLVECNTKHLENLRSRKAALVEKAAWNKTGKILKFNATDDSVLASLADIHQNNAHDRSHFTEICVDTMTLDEILTQANAPKTIDYISVDVEGVELNVLEGLTPGKWDINSINLEHNHDVERPAEFDRLMKDYGLVRVLENVSDFDAYYTKEESLFNFRKIFNII